MGGNIITSGSYLGSDMSVSQTDIDFCKDVLKFRYGNSFEDCGTYTTATGNGMTMSFISAINDKRYAVTSPESLIPEGNAIPIIRYNKYNKSAAIFYNGEDFRSCAIGFPFESILESNVRNSLMNMILRTFEEKH